jgi:hypothetical protein
LPPSSSSRSLHAKFISACSGKIIKLSLGRASFAHPKWLGLARPSFF